MSVLIIKIDYYFLPYLMPILDIFLDNVIIIEVVFRKKGDTILPSCKV